MQPLWELYYATQIQNYFPEANVDILDLRREDPGANFENHVKKLPEREMYTYWIMKSGDSVEIASIVKILREMYPKAIHVAGGTHVDMCTQECEAVFDAVIVGPGEVSFKQIVEEARIGQLKKKYTMSCKDVPFAETPWPVREFVDRDSIVNTELFKQYGGTQTSMYLSRGCVYSCAYCVTTFHLPYRFVPKK